MTDALSGAASAVAHWHGFEGASMAPLAGGLINESYLVDGERGRFVLQRVHPIFDPRVHENIALVTGELARAGLTTPELVRTEAGALWLVHPSGVWRLTSHVAGVSSAVVESPAQARSAGELIGRFHRVLGGLEARFVAARSGVHDTDRHLAKLAEAVASHGGHRLHRQVTDLARAIVAARGRVEPLPDLAPIAGHGDLKISNVIFDSAATNRAICLVDLDTVGPIHLAHELGDMWRSWCNRAAEDELAPRLDLEVLAHSWAGWVTGRGLAPSAAERQAALLGPEIISLELAARFAADALVEAYFGYDAARFPARGEHNLARAKGQFALHLETVRTRPDRSAIVGSTKYHV